MRLWKWLGLAAAVGIAATGTAVVVRKRRWRHYDADELRSELQRRYQQAAQRG